MTEELTWSVCPVCRKKIPARRVPEGTAVRMVKNCPEHGAFSALLWRGEADWEEWRGELPPEEAEEMRASGGPDCGNCRVLCREHRRNTCCTLLEVTARCQMKCTFCFAGDSSEADPPAEQVKAWIFDLTEPGQTFLQLSGGEPTLREDLPELIAFAVKVGCRYVQLNSNGLRLAEDEDYVRRLAEAGLSFVFLQFDGLTEDVYLALRGRPMMNIKRRAIENCGKYGIGVTLVPVIVPGVNDRQIGDMIRFGIEKSPVVRGIHFQPVSYFGRIPALPREEDRYTLDQLLRAVVQQSGGLVEEKNLIPSCCDHPMCGFHGDFVVMPDRSLLSLTGKRSRVCCGPEEAGFDPAEKNREFIGRRWKRADGAGGGSEENRYGAGDDSPETGHGTGAGGAESEPVDMTDMDEFLDRVNRYGFTITSMDFQDAGNLDFERLRRCSLHVYRRGRLVPFCAAYLSTFPSDEEEML